MLNFLLLASMAIPCKQIKYMPNIGASTLAMAKTWVVEVLTRSPYVGITMPFAANDELT